VDTLPFLSPRRLVVVESADPFVTRHRADLEKLFARKEHSKTGVLVLEVKTWPSNTRLAKALDDAAAIVCKAPTTQKLAGWVAQWAQSAHGKRLSADAARLLVDLVGPDMGLLDQELAKLAVYVGDAAGVEAADVDRLTGNSREEDVWKVFSAIADGRPADALSILDRLLDQGNEPVAVLSGPFSWQLRRLAQAYRLTRQGRTVSAALAEAGVPRGEALLRHLGPDRAGKLFDWLLEADLGLKGSSQLPPRVLLERFIVKLARKSPAPR